MNLNELFNKINQRKKKITVAYPLFKAGRHKAALMSEGVLGFFNAEVYKQVSQDIYVFEYYLLQLDEAISLGVAEKEEISKAQSEIHQILTDLYTLQSSKKYDANRSIETIKESHAKQSNYRLIDATQNNDIELFDASMAAGANVDFNYCGDTPLIYAVENSNYAMVRRLIDAGVNVNAIVNLVVEKSALHSAVNNLAMVQLLIEAKADVNQRVDEETLLYKASSWNVSVELFRYLLTIPGIDINATTRTRYGGYLGQTVLSDLLKHMKSYRDLQNGRDLVQATIEKINYLLKAGIKKVQGDFFAAIDAGVDAVNIMLAADYKCTAKGLTHAIECLNRDVIDLLIKNCSASHQAMEKLIKYQGYSKLMFYVAIGDIEAVKTELQESKETINAVNEHNESALMLASTLGRTEIAQLLLAAGADVNQTDHCGVTSLMLAAKANHVNTVRVLLNNNAEVNKQKAGYPKGETALLMATKANASDVVEVLLGVNDIETTINVDDNKCANEIGLKSTNERIKKAYYLYNHQPLISEINKQIQHFMENGKARFGINNTKKAIKIQDALNRAMQCKAPLCSMYEFLNYKESGKESLNDALSFHRIGFFGKPRSMEKIETFVDGLYPR